MPSLSFKPRFADPILALIKDGTIRNHRKVPIKVGDVLYLFTGLRTKHTFRLGQAVCSEVWRIRIWFNRPRIRIWNKGFVYLDYDLKEVPCFIMLLDEFAVSDGFKDFADMKAFWINTHGVKKGNRKVILRPYTGTLYKWKNFVETRVKLTEKNPLLWEGIKKISKIPL